MDTGFDTLGMQTAGAGAAEPDTMTPMESALARMWAAILERDHVGRDDNFFLLGGDSLRAATLFAEVEATFGVALPLETIFDEGETVAGMALLIERATGTPSQVAGSAGAVQPPGDKADAKNTAAPTPLVAKGDLTAALTLLVLAVVAWIPRGAALRAVCRLFARIHVALRGTRAGDLDSVIDRLDRRIAARDIEIGMVASGYEEMADMLREYGPARRRPVVRLRGREHLDAALAAGHGAVLWNFIGMRGSRFAAQTLKEAGVPIIQLRSAAHPLSGSAFGARFLNPILNRIDDRHLAGSAIVDYNAAVEAMQQLGSHLRANEVVRISANGAGDTPHEMPFLGGTLRLALGAPTLALLHGAPLIPIFSIPDGSGGFDVTIEAPLVAAQGGTTGDRARRLAQRYAGMLDSYVRRHPDQWRGWFMRNTWLPGSSTDS